jgi:hypothetical protein
MLKIIFIGLFIPFILLADNPFYTIKLAVYKNLPNLQKNISKLSPSLHRTIQIQQVGNVYKAFVHPTKDKVHLTQTLSSYKKVFRDAFITSIKASEVSHVVKTNKIKNRTLSFYDKIKQHTLYLCSGGDGKSNLKFLIEVTFKKDTVTYKPIIGKMPPVSALYTIKNHKLFLYQKGLLNHNVYSTLEKTYSNYYLIASWIGKKKVNTLRYYFNENDAKAYIHSL